MFFIKKVLTPFLIPPGCFITLSFFVALYFFVKREKKNVLVFLLLSGLIWVVSIKPLADFFIHPLEYRYLRPDNLSADVIIVLGGGITENVPDLSSTSFLKNDALARLVEAFRIYRRTGAPIMCTGGKVFSDRSEARVAAEILKDFGVKESGIIIEDRSRDTYENAKYSFKICSEKGFSDIVLVTSAYHLPRAVMAFEKAGFKNIKPFGAAYKSTLKPQYRFCDFLPGQLQDFSSALREYFGLIFYKIYL